ncbi:MAG: hypothetical protein ACJA2S_001050 [Cyclobacteriaceae bacterium]|jgi:hypothetical protein
MTRQLHIAHLDSNQISLIETGHDLSKSLLRFLRLLSGEIVGVIAIVILLPLTGLLILIIFGFIRVMLERLAYGLRKAEKIYANQEDRVLMESLIDLEKLEGVFSLVKKNGKSGMSKHYNDFIFGGSLARCEGVNNRLINKITQKVYPNIDDEPTEEQIQRLLKEYDNLPVD